MCLIKGAFVGEKNFDVIKMHGTTIKNKYETLNIIICYPVNNIYPIVGSFVSCISNV